MGKTISRIHFALCAGAWFLLLLPARATERQQVDFDYVNKIALERAKSPFHSPRADMPEVLRQDKLDYDKYRQIRFRRDRDFWAGDKLPFRAEFFHPGYIYQEPVQIYEFTKDFVQHVRFVQDWFDYGKLNIQNEIPVNTGYAGFKIYYPINKPDTFDEIASFLGASYFRMLGKGQRYGPSARGLALDCGGTGQPEEFPIFTDFWLGKPAMGDAELLVFAVLDSVSCTGAYQFRIHPGEATVAEIEATLYFRKDDKVRAADKNRKPLQTIGIAPLTSMFWFGENSERKFDDYRPEVHDSDGLLMQMDPGENIWRPLDNSTVMRHTVFTASNVRGFGVLQRDRDFGHYMDMFNPYHCVPSIWVRPKGDWGEGEVHLVELPTTSEGLDNIVAFWNPKQKPEPLQPFHFSYDLLWTSNTGSDLSPNRVLSTRIGNVPGALTQRQFHVEFAGPKLDGIPENEPPQASVSCTGDAKIFETQVVRDSYDGAWRVVIKFEPAPDNKQPVDFRCSLKKGDETVSETWAYLWSPM